MLAVPIPFVKLENITNTVCVMRDWLETQNEHVNQKLSVAMTTVLVASISSVMVEFVNQNVEVIRIV